MTENFHYAGIILAVAEFAKNIDLTYETIGSGASQTTIYNIKSNDSHDINFNINLNTYQTHPTELQEKVYKLVAYVKNTNSKSAPVTIYDDSALWTNLLYIINRHNQKAEHVFNLCKAGRLPMEKFTSMVNPFNRVIARRYEIERTFIPLTREHISYLIAEGLAANCYATSNTILLSDVMNQIYRALDVVGYNKEEIDKMIQQNKPLPAPKEKE